MKKITLLVVAVVIALLFNSCIGYEPIPSKISMKIGPGYTSNSTSYITVDTSQVITVGIIASTLSSNTTLKTFQITNLYDASGTTNTYLTQNISSEDAKYFNHDFSFKTRNIVGTEQWTFSVTNSDGVTNQVYVLLNVQSY